MRTVSEYLDLPYHRVIQPDESGFWSAHVLELDGVFSEGETAAEAAENLGLAMGLWIEHELARVTRSRNPVAARVGQATTDRDGPGLTRGLGPRRFVALRAGAA